MINPISLLKDRLNFHDRAVLITGASSGIGEDIAQALGRLGAQIGLIARRKTKLQELADRIAAQGGRALPLACDVTRRSEVDQAVRRAANAFGKIDILINSAGVLIPAHTEDARIEDLDAMMRTNFYGMVHMIQAVLPLMREAGSGQIVNIASLAGRRGFSPIGGYSATKFAVVGFTEALRIELVGSGITASLVMPGLIDTPMADNALPGAENLSALPKLAMPANWVTWAILAALLFGWSEIGVPPGAATMQKLSAFFPGTTDVMLNLGARMLERFGRIEQYREATGEAEPLSPPAKSRSKRRL
jgi:NAD(P)-dependent dehydrogenase (short-subunit alcohol dehydrogenase family)